MVYNRIWFNKDKYAITLGGGQMTNPGRYLTLLPPINGADAISGSPYFTENPGTKRTCGMPRPLSTGCPTVHHVVGGGWLPAF